MERILTEAERWVILNALNVAKLQYEADMAQVNLHPSLHRQFRMQATDAQAMYELLEQAADIAVGHACEGVTTVDGHGAYCMHCGDTLA